MKSRKMELLFLLLATALIAGIANADTTTGLQGYWAFDEGGGPTAYDSSPNSYDGTLKGTPTWDSGPEDFGGALLFDAGSSGDGVECGTACDPGDVFTLAIWAYWNGNPAPDGTSVHFMTKADAWDAAAMRWQWELWAGRPGDLLDKPGISCAGFGSIALSADAMPANEWVHLTITFDGTNAALFINGVADPLGPQAFSIGTKTNAMFYIGVDTKYRRSFDGYLDEARIYNRVLSQSDIQMLMTTDKAINIAPANGAELVALDTNLVWGPPPVFTPTKYDLYYKAGDPNLAVGATVITDIVRTDPCNVYDPPVDFANDTTIYWRVDSYAPSYPSDPCIGSAWSFTTAPAEPVVTEDPCSLTVALGATAVFRVKDVNGVDYTWKRQSDNETVGSNSPVLTLTDVQKDPCEDSYYCIVSNTSGSAPPSAAATLWTKRLVARWEFEDNLEDSEATGWHGDYTDPNFANDPPTPVFVLDPCSIDGGKALQLAADELHVRITDSEDYFNFYPQGYTVNAWVKTVQADAYGAMASKQDTAGYPDFRGWILNCTNDNGKAINSLRQVAGAKGTTNVADDQWRMVTGTYDAETGVVAVYVDGKLETESAPSSDVAPTNAYPVVLGAGTVLGETSAYEGLLDKVSIYSYALSPVDVAVLYTDVMTGESICMEQIKHDYNGDCRVDILDFAMFATDWLECYIVPTCMP